ncbi:MAG: rhamnulokinase [Ignavibacteria bacterium]|nr:rhamnulokinase [Ignavibacteria bacterium]
MESQTFVAFDLGAESGRTVAGTLTESKLSVQEVSRFPNEMVLTEGHLHWDIHRLFREMKEGLARCIMSGMRPRSVGVDTWGVDYGLLDQHGSFVGLPYAYRDHRTDGAMEEVFGKISRERVYELTGIQFMQLNTLFQLFAARRDEPAVLEQARKFLFMPDIFNYFLTGETATEFTFATTSQLYNPRTGQWEQELFLALEVPIALMQKIIPSGTVLGPLSKTVSEEASLGDLVVVSVASHDTGSAIAAIPAESDDWAYISSGTWSLMGVETKQPIISESALHFNYTNEGGVGGTFRFLKNIMGLWLLQQCRKAWLPRQYSYSELTEMISQAAAFRSLLDPDYPAYFNPPDMPAAIREFCRITSQPVPDSHADYIRCILESLALKYRLVLDQLRTLHHRPINRIHIIGGGAQNKVLCQFTADATGLPVLAGPIEATAIGNVMMQALALRVVGSLSEMRQIIGQSFQPVVYQPRNGELWESAFDHFKAIIQTKVN